MMDANDQQSRDADAKLYLSARDAADMLGVAVTSLYAYVSRKGIRSQPVAGTRKRIYWREDVEKAARRGSAQRILDHDILLAPDTRITLLTENGPYYRGHSALALAATATLEEAAALLWEQPVDLVFPSDPPTVPEALFAARDGLRGLSPRAQAGGLFPLLEKHHERGFDRSALGFARAGGELMRWFAALTAGARLPSTDPIHLVLARGCGREAAYADVIRHALVLLADHELTADTYAVRAVANTGCTPHEAVIVGMLATSGRRIDQGQPNAMRRLFEEIVASPDPARPIISRCRSGERVPGFRDAQTSGKDQRALSLFAAIEQAVGDDPEIRQMLTAISVAREAMDLEVTMSLAVVFLEWKLGVPAREFALKITARIAGWIAHAFEQSETQHVVRPRAAYTGQLPLGG